MISLAHKEFDLRVDAGELIGFSHAGHEFMHQKGSPGWRNSDTEMFPIIGPTADADYEVRTPRGTAVQDQHGLLREMDYHLLEQSGTHLVFEKAYTAGTHVRNSKYPEKSAVEQLSWPYGFLLRKIYRLGDEGLTVAFRVSGESGMPFMLGYHPAFRLQISRPFVQANDRHIPLADIIAVGSRAYQVPDCSDIQLHDARVLRITTEGFGHFMLWTEVANMLCIEPITFYPYAVSQDNLHQGLQTLSSNTMEFMVNLLPQ